ncbi:MAG: hypothetical protein D6679_08625 [Candidatus Hydrogenedentota bacterium]|nr:MAG: hypothetical protein D6679_08625 [Candidatus Hydrogenedentota bacterium]
MFFRPAFFQRRFSGKHGRFTVSRHLKKHSSHFDLFLETSRKGKLRAFRLERWPPEPSDIARISFPHRRIYLTYSGPLSRGRGTVTVVERGRFLLQHGRISLKFGRRVVCGILRGEEILFL